MAFLLSFFFLSFLVVSTDVLSPSPSVLELDILGLEVPLFEEQEGIFLDWGQHFRRSTRPPHVPYIQIAYDKKGIASSWLEAAFPCVSNTFIDVIRAGLPTLREVTDKYYAPYIPRCK